MIENQALAMALALAGGYGAALAVKRLKLPSVTGYILIGLLFSPSLLNLITVEMSQQFDLVKTLGLGVIAFIVGAELEIERIRNIRAAIILSSAGLSIVTFGAVFIAMYFLAGLPLPIALVLGATATATAPAPVITVIKEVRATGTLARTLLGIVAMADAFAIFLFGIISAVVATMLADINTVSGAAFVETGQELLGSVIIGVISGLILVYLAKSAGDRKHILVVTLSVILFNSGLSQMFHLSPLLVNLVTGFTLANLARRPATVFASLEGIELPLFIVFFTLAGASLRLDVLVANWQVALIYILARTIGIVTGVTAGASFAGVDPKLRPFLGRSLLSKAGVTIGLILLVQIRFPEIAPMVTAVELAAISVFEVVGPVITRNSLFAAGEATE
ncbi:cation:proton antiporter [Dethiobacter alkaliphilus]|uniref:Sodium/hydrogen exchanger n=1 Tax=Dethiobacter alkaliphilus AHT 1 TaxID=555088 RepID=C0GDL6_DETAL|nr:cation:proton antiporter [Dethiobacter alkaliphilus]EEG78499.1 sodium/hydrogen exchanger [Dethiobacter alkaliphilus AHT 1]